MTAAPTSSALAPLARRVLDFEPARDGFGFVNTFAWTPEDLAALAAEVRPLAAAATVAVPALAGALGGGRRGLLGGAAVGALGAALGLGAGVVRGTARRWPSFGLCGGMALEAVGRWPRAEVAGRPAGLATSGLGRDDVRALLRRRQAETLRAAGARFLGYWLVLRLRPGASEHPPFGADLARELARVREAVDAGRPVVLGLAGDAPDPFQMHQVVAYGYAAEPDGALRLDVYDPNAPGQARYVRAAVAGGACEITTDLPTGRRRGGGVHVHSHAGRLGMVFVVGA